MSSQTAALACVLLLLTLGPVSAEQTVDDAEPPSVAAFLIEVGEAYERVGRFAEALHEFRKVLLYDPHHPQALAYIHAIEERLEQARTQAVTDAARRLALQSVKEERARAMNEALASAESRQHPPALAGIPAEKPFGEPMPAPAGAPAERPVLAQAPFESYLIEKPAELLQEEAALEQLAEQALRPPEEPTTIPDAAKPSVQLDGIVSFSHLNPHTAAPERQLVTSLSGTAHGLDVRGELSRKDASGIFRHDYGYLNFSRPDLFLGLFDQSTDLSPLRGQSEDYVEGVKLRRAWSDRHTSLFVAGRTDNTVSGSTGSTTYLGRLYQLQEEFKPVSWLKLRSALFYTENDADIDALSGTSGIPRQNLVSFADATVTLPHDLSVSGQFARADYEADNQPDEPLTDWNWRVASSLKRPRYHLSFAYEFVGEDYASVGNPDVYQDFSGWNLQGTMRLTEDWSVSGSAVRQRDNVSDDPASIRQDNQALTVSSSVRLPADRAVTVSYSDFLTDPAGPNAGSSSHTRLSRVDYLFPFFLDTRALVNYQFLQTLQPAGSNSDSHEVGGSLFKGFAGGSSVFLSHTLRVPWFETEADSVLSTTSANVTYAAHPRLNLYANTAYSRNATEGSRGVDTLSASAGFRVDLLDDTVFTTEYRVNSYDLDTERGELPDDWSLFFLVSQRFGFQSAPNFGTIEGRVVQDLNADGVADPAEPGVDDVTLRLDDARTAMTSARGTFRFAKVVPGVATVSLDPGSLPETWALPVLAKQVQVKGWRVAAVEFPLIEVASLAGVVFIDDNQDGVFQEHEEPLEGIAVVLSPGEQFRRTDADGRFHFDHLLPGAYAVRVHQADLPIGYALAGEEELALALNPGDERTDLVFPVRLLQSAE